MELAVQGLLIESFVESISGFCRHRLNKAVVAPILLHQVDESEGPGQVGTLCFFGFSRVRVRVWDCMTKSIIESTTQTNLSEGEDFHLLEPRSLSGLPDFQGPFFYVFFPRAAPGCWERLVSSLGRRLTEVEGVWLSLKIPPAKAGQTRFTHEALWRGEGTGAGGRGQECLLYRRLLAEEGAQLLPGCGLPLCGLGPRS